MEWPYAIECFEYPKDYFPSDDLFEEVMMGVVY